MRFILKIIVTIIFTISTLCVLPSCKKHTKLSSYDLSVKYEDGKIDGKLVYKFVNSYKTTFNHVIFNLHANAYKENATYRPTTSTNEAKGYPEGVSYGKIEIDNVLIKGSVAKHQIYGEDDNFLKVDVGSVKKGNSVTIEIDFTTYIPKSALRLGENSLGVNLADFFPVACKVQNGKFLEINYAPVGDPYFADLHDYEIDITVPSEYTVASSGFPTLTNVDGITTTYSYSLQKGRDFAFLLSKNYSVASKTSDGVVFTYYGYDSDVEEMLRLAIDAVGYFSKAFGEYPYKSLSLAECNLAFGGMEYTGLCFIDYTLEKEDKKSVITHEIAHQWWHSCVTNNQYTSGYIDEGLAEYSTYLYFKARKGKDVADEMINNAKLAYKSFFSINETLSGKVNTVMQRELSTFKNEYEYANVAYNKSLIMFYEYGKAIGEDKAIKKLAKLYKSNLNGELSLEKLIKTLGYGDHFKSFVYGNVLI